MTVLGRISIAAAALCLGASSALAEGDPARGKKVFGKCKVCHMVGDKAKKRVGPILNNIIGAKAGAQDGFKYSKAMLKAAEGGLVWTEDKLSAYLEKPKKIVPRGSMAFVGLRKAADRADVIAYLEQFTKSE